MSAYLVDMTFSISGGPKTVYAGSFAVPTGTHTVVVTTDPVKHDVAVQMDGVVRTSTTFTDKHIHVAPITPHSSGPSNLLVIQKEPTPRPTLCQGLIH